jgi:hypothetical protein
MARGPRDEQPSEPGWYGASDGRWWPPESRLQTSPTSQWSETAAPRRSNDSHCRALSDDDATRIAESINAIRNESSYREQARRIAAEMAAAPTVDALLTELLATG